MRLYADDIMFFISNTTSVLQAHICSEGFSFLRMSEQQIKEKKNMMLKPVLKLNI